MITLKKVTKVYKMGDSDVVALDRMDLEIKQGECVAIMGPSGSGKSTLLNIIGCIDIPTSGKVRFNGEDVSKLKDARLTKIRLMHIGFVFQQFYLIPTLTAAENIMLPMREAGVKKAEMKSRAEELLATVKLEKRANHYPNQLSGGEQQRVAIARALANNPEVILADEPTGELDTKTAKRIIGLLRALNRTDKITLIIVTHDPKVANSTDRIIVLEDGRILSDSPPTEEGLVPKAMARVEEWREKAEKKGGGKVVGADDGGDKEDEER